MKDLKKGVINIRKVVKRSLGLTLPHDLVEFAKLKEGKYIYTSSIQGDEIIIKLKCLEEN
jgi:antitoxin component of MazEF toxin-antitoxin module